MRLLVVYLFSLALAGCDGVRYTRVEYIPESRKLVRVTQGSVIDDMEGPVKIIQFDGYVISDSYLIEIRNALAKCKEEKQ